MGLFNRRTTDEETYTDRPIDRDRRHLGDRDADGDLDHGERTGAKPGTIRALFTLAAVAGAGLLFWIASTLDYTGSTSEYWIAIGLIAAGGFALGISQLLGGWTKWGVPTMSPGMFLFAFLPTLVVAGWILLAKQPQSGVEEGRLDRWSGDIGVSGLVNDLFELWPLLALVTGLVLAFTFDTTGPRTRILRRDAGVPDEDVHDYRRETTTTSATGEPVGATAATRDRDLSDDRTVSEELRDRDRGDTVVTGSRDDRDLDRRDRS